MKSMSFHQNILLHKYNNKVSNKLNTKISAAYKKKRWLWDRKTSESSLTFT